MASTANGWPYPLATDTPDVPRDVSALATALQAAAVPVKTLAGVASVALAAAPTGTVVVTFPAGTFTKAPVVSLTKVSPSGAATGLVPMVIALSASAMTIGLYQAAGTPVTVTVPVHYVAIQATP